MNPAANRSAAKVALWSALYFAFHSALSSFGAKNAAARLVGKRNNDGFYRLCFSTVSMIGLLWLFFAARRLPDRKIYHAKGWGLLASLAVFGAACAAIFTVVKRVRALRLFGAENALRFLSGAKLEAAPEGQLPPADEISCPPSWERDGALALSRHALNFWIVPAFWAWPRMTRNYAAFCAVMTLYCVVGSWLSERRQRARYGKSWQRYEKSGVPFFLPKLPQKDAARQDN